jgi:hypothetical protein
MIGRSSQGIESKVVADKNVDPQEVGNRGWLQLHRIPKNPAWRPDAEALLNANAEGSRARALRHESRMH